MIARRAFALALVWGAAVSAAEAVPPVVRDVRLRMADDPVLRGTFEQRKSVKGFRNPLLSRGDFVVARGRGVLWRTREPFATTLVVMQGGVVSLNAEGAVARRLSASEEPGVRAISETLFALMSADLAVLAQRFQIEGELSAGSWRLQLLPRDPVLSRWLQRVELEGDRFLRGVRLLESSGDQTQIRLAGHAGAAALTPQEEKQFE